MAKQLKSSKKSSKEPEQTQVEEEVIEIPANLPEFYMHLEQARKVLEFAREALGGSSVYEDFVEELRSTNETMSDIETRIRQLSDLEEVLASAKFTNKDSVNEKIRKKVIEELTRHFKFQRLDQLEEEEDIIVVDDEPQTPDTTPKKPKVKFPSAVEKAPSRDLSSVRAEAKAEAQAELGGMAKMYEEAANTTYGETGEDFYANLPDDLDGMTSEEIKAAFPDIDSGTLKRVEQLKRLAPKKMGDASIKGGITRRES